MYRWKKANKTKLIGIRHNKCDPRLQVSIFIAYHDQLGHKKAQNEHIELRMILS